MLVARIGLCVLLVLFFWGVNVVRKADRRERNRLRPDNPADEPWQTNCPTCGEPYVSWSYTPAMVGFRGQTLREASHVIRCRNGHVWP